MPATTKVRAFSAAAAPKGGLNVVTECTVGLGIGMVFGVMWKSWHYGQKSKIEEYYANRN
jgi:hypothetical protein